MNISKKITTTAIAALMISPIGLAATNVSLSHPAIAQAAQQNNLIAWNQKNGRATNSADKEPRTNMPDQIKIVQGNPSKGFLFTIPGSSKTYAASAKSPLAAQLRYLSVSHAGANDGAGPSKSPKLGNPNAKTQPKLTPQKTPHTQAPKQRVLNPQATKPKGHHKLVQTSESSTGARVMAIGFVVAILAVIYAKIDKSSKNKKTI